MSRHVKRRAIRPPRHRCAGLPSCPGECWPPWAWTRRERWSEFARVRRFRSIRWPAGCRPEPEWGGPIRWSGWGGSRRSGTSRRCSPWRRPARRRWRTRRRLERGSSRCWWQANRRRSHSRARSRPSEAKVWESGSLRAGACRSSTPRWWRRCWGSRGRTWESTGCVAGSPDSAAPSPLRS